MPHEWSPSNPDNVIRKYISGESVNKLSIKYKIGRKAVSGFLNRNGVELRNQSEAELLKWSKMSLKKRKAQTVAANKAMRGTSRSLSTKIKTAKTRESKQLHISKYEIKVSKILSRNKFKLTSQKAIGPYNCDIAVSSVAVEIFGGGWHLGGRHAARARKRFAYIRDQGWHVFIIFIDARRNPLTSSATDNLISFIKRTRRLPKSRREYRMVGGAGNLMTSGCLYDDYDSFVESLGGS